eukprot:scaffold1669_cov108-Isochrysis_galbana.AAC.3
MDKPARAAPCRSVQCMLGDRRLSPLVPAACYCLHGQAASSPGQGCDVCLKCESGSSSGCVRPCLGLGGEKSSGGERERGAWHTYLSATISPSGVDWFMLISLDFVVPYPYFGDLSCTVYYMSYF